MDPNYTDEVKWLVNIESLIKDFKNIPYFDESLRYYGPILHIVGGKSNQYPFEAS